MSWLFGIWSQFRCFGNLTALTGFLAFVFCVCLSGHGGKKSLDPYELLQTLWREGGLTGSFDIETAMICNLMLFCPCPSITPLPPFLTLHILSLNEVITASFKETYPPEVSHSRISGFNSNQVIYLNCTAAERVQAGYL